LRINFGSARRMGLLGGDCGDRVLCDQVVAAELSAKDEMKAVLNAVPSLAGRDRQSPV
jgi:hypothetical protein